VYDYGAALSEHPLATHATGEVVGAVLEQVGPGPDLAVVFVTAAHVGALEDIAATVRATLGPRTLVGASAISVLGGDREVEEQPAVCLWAGHVGPVTPVSLDIAAGADGPVLVGLDPARLESASTLLLVADPAGFAADAALRALRETAPHLDVVGGIASAGFGPGANRLVLDGSVRSSGAVGVLLDGAERVRSVVSQGCRPVGQALTVTSADGPMLRELAGRTALDRLRDLVEDLSPDDRVLARNGLHLGRVIDEHKPDFGRGDFLIRNIRGVDPDNGALSVGDVVEVGDTVQFQLRDADSADEDLNILLAGEHARSALVFTCNGRGNRLFGYPDHDATVVADSIGSRAVAGMFCAGELGPVGGQNFLHGFTASIALFA